MLRSTVRLSAATFAVTWALTDGVGDLPNPLFVPMPGTTARQRAAAQGAAMDELRQGGGREVERFAERLESTYRLLARADTECYGWIVRTDGSDYSAVVACRGGRAVLGVLEDDAVLLRPVNADIPAEALLDALPGVPPARVRSVTVAAEDFQRARGDGAPGGDEGFSGFRTTAPPLSPDVWELCTMLAGPVTGKGQLFAAVRDGRGTRAASDRPINFIDTAEGRTLFYTTINSAGHEWINAHPGTADGFLRALYDTRHALL
ncbi:MAG: ESX secretion-associated protein EspG [Sciscionella sp.]